MENLQTWLAKQWGEGTKYASPRQLALAISDGKDQNAYSNIERNGLTTFGRAQGLAKATDTTPLHILLMAGIVLEADVEAVGGKTLTTGEFQAAALWREMPEDFAAAWLRSGAELLELAQGSSE